MVNTIFQAVAEHAAGVEAFDDQTVVAIRVRDTPPKHAHPKDDAGKDSAAKKK